MITWGLIPTQPGHGPEKQRLKFLSSPVVLPDWSSTLRAARERQIDLVMTLGVTAERLDYLAFTVGAMPLPGAVFARQGTSTDLSRARFVLERNFLAVDHGTRTSRTIGVLPITSSIVG